MWPFNKRKVFCCDCCYHQSFAEGSILIHLCFHPRELDITETFLCREKSTQTRCEDKNGDNYCKDYASTAEIIRRFQ